MTAPPKPPPGTVPPAWATTEPGAIVFIDPSTEGYTMNEIYDLFGPGAPLEEDDSLTAAAEIHTGAMIALIPTEEDAERLVLDGGEPLEQLHLTLLYLGDAVDIDDESRTSLLERIQTVTSEMTSPVRGNAFGAAVFNPGDEQCTVILVGSAPGIPLNDVHDAAIWAAEESYIDTSMHKMPWIPHVTLMYSDTMIGDVDEIEQRMGPILFDRIRVAFGGEVHDFDLPIPMQPILAAMDAFHMPGKHDQSDHGKGGDGKKKPTDKKPAKAPRTRKPKEAPAPPAPAPAPAPAPSGGPAKKGPEAHEQIPEGITPGKDGALNGDEYQALISYSGTGYEDINKGLRSPGGPTGRAAREVEAIDGVMSRSKLAEDIEVERGVLSGSAVFGDAWEGSMVGGTFTEPSFVSTTSNPSVTQQFADPRSRASASIVMRVPAGTGAVDLGDSLGEAEILLDRGLTWQIVEDTGPGRGRVITMELVV